MLSSLSIGFIVGGSVVFTCILLGFVVWIVRHRRSHTKPASPAAGTLAGLNPLNRKQTVAMGVPNDVIQRPNRLSTYFRGESLESNQTSPSGLMPDNSVIDNEIQTAGKQNGLSNSSFTTMSQDQGVSNYETVIYEETQQETLVKGTSVEDGHNDASKDEVEDSYQAFIFFAEDKEFMGSKNKPFESDPRTDEYFILEKEHEDPCQNQISVSEELPKPEGKKRTCQEQVHQAGDENNYFILEKEAEDAVGEPRAHRDKQIDLHKQDADLQSEDQNYFILEKH